jgi:hypothetical protein
MLRKLGFVSTFVCLLVGAGAGAQECDKTFDSTFDLLREAVFEGRGCTSATCHVGPLPAGDLDLTGDDVWENLIDADVTSVPPTVMSGLKRVVPGQKDTSLLWLNLAAATLPEQWDAPLRPMPIGLAALTLDELEAVRLWIEGGAPKDGVIEGTDELLDACLPEPKPIRINPLPPPPAGSGVQIKMPQWTLPAKSEDEVCFVSYFDVTDQVPERFRGPNGTSFRYDRSQIRQNPGSHHLIVNSYLGAADIDDPRWGEFTCKGGELAGEPCDPKDLDACGAGLCGSEPQTALACIGHGPPDAGLLSIPFTGTQESSSSINFLEGVYREVPIKGVIVWNSHAFNLTNEDSLIEAWLNFEFAEKQEKFAIGIFDTSDIFKMRAAPFTADEVCAHHVLASDARVFELNSHMHQRGKRFRIFDAMFTCQGGPNDGEPCSPFGADEMFATDGQCGGATCAARQDPEIGDCDGDLSVSIGDLIRGVGVALGTAPLDACSRMDGDGDGRISIAEVIRAVRAAQAGDRFVDPDDSLIYASFEYNDPVVQRYDPPLEFAAAGEPEALRTLTYCAVYDNGFLDPSEVKKKSTSPPTPNDIGIGGPCATPTGCTEGNVGGVCAGGTQEQRDASCDSSPGAGDGVCDACLLRGGVTTEDEMFVLIGNYFRDN